MIYWLRLNNLIYCCCCTYGHRRGATLLIVWGEGVDGQGKERNVVWSEKDVAPAAWWMGHAVNGTIGGAPSNGIGGTRDANGTTAKENEGLKTQAFVFENCLYFVYVKD